MMWDMSKAGPVVRRIDFDLPYPQMDGPAVAFFGDGRGGYFTYDQINIGFVGESPSEREEKLRALAREKIDAEAKSDSIIVWRHRPELSEESESTGLFARFCVARPEDIEHIKKVIADLSRENT
jgi:hypothetical protein